MVWAVIIAAVALMGSLLWVVYEASASSRRDGELIRHIRGCIDHVISVAAY